MGTVNSQNCSSHKHHQLSEISESAKELLEDLSLESWKRRVPVILYLSLLVVLGTAGNALCFVVYYRCYRPSSTRVFVLALSACDLLTNLVALPLQMYSIRMSYNTFGDTMCHALFVFATIPTQASGFLLVLVAYDRYRHICKPFAWQLTPNKTWSLVAVASVLTLVVFIAFTPVYGEHTVTRVDCNNVTVHMCWFDDNWKDKDYPTAYSIVVLVSFLLGCVAMTIFYACIGVHVYRHHRRMHQMFLTITSRSGLSGRSSDAKVANGAEDCSVRDLDDDESCNNDNTSRASKLTVVSVDSVLNLLNVEPFTSSRRHDRGNLADDDDVFYTATSREISTVAVRGASEDGGQCMNSSALGRRRQVKTNSGYSNRRRSSARTTLMMCVLTGFYVINWLPHLVLRLGSVIWFWV